MTQNLQLFPIRAPIGTNVNGQVFMTPEFFRALNVVNTDIDNVVASDRVKSGTQVINCGEIGRFSNESSIFVAEPKVQSNSRIFTTLRRIQTSNHSIDEVLFDNITTMALNIISGSGFTLMVLCNNGSLYGEYSVDWSLSYGD